MIKYIIGRQGVPGNVQQAFNILRKQMLKYFPSTEVKKRTFPKRIIMGYTSEIVNVVRLRGLLTRPNILSHIPPTCQAFRECIVKSIPCFKYGGNMDGTFLNTSIVGRDENQEYYCICAEPFWSKYAVCIKDCLLYTSPSPRDGLLSRMPSSA